MEESVSCDACESFFRDINRCFEKPYDLILIAFVWFVIYTSGFRNQDRE